MLDLIAIMIVGLAIQDPPEPLALSPRPEEFLDLAPLAVGPARAPDPRIAAEAVVIFNQVFRHWGLRCDDPQFVSERIQFDVVLDREGRIISGPTPVNPQDDAAWRATAESARIALIASAPFDVPENYAGGRYRPTFNPARACGGH